MNKLMKYYSHRKPGLSNECLNRFKNDSSLKILARVSMPYMPR